MSVVLQSFSASFDGVYNIPKASSGESIPPEKLLITGTPTNTKITFGVIINGANIEGELTGNFQYTSVLPKNSLEYKNTVNGTVSGSKIYINKVLVQTTDYSPSANVKDEDLAVTDKKAAERLYSGNDTFIGPINVTKDESNSDAVDGFDGNDIFYSNGSGKNDDLFYGGNGIDTSVLSNKLINYTITSSSAIWNDYTQKSDMKGFIVKAKVGSDNQQVSGVERLKFSDTSLALDIDGNAGTALKILGAVFGKSTIKNKDYVGIGLDLLDKGVSYETLAGLALDAAKATTNDQIVTTLWTNVVGSAPSTNDKAPFIKLLQDGLSSGALARLAADTSTNVNNINLVGLAQTGVEYTPFG